MPRYTCIILYHKSPLFSSPFPYIPMNFFVLDTFFRPSPECRFHMVYSLVLLLIPCRFLISHHSPCGIRHLIRSRILFRCSSVITPLSYKVSLKYNIHNCSQIPCFSCADMDFFFSAGIFIPAPCILLRNFHSPPIIFTEFR